VFTKDQLLSIGKGALMAAAGAGLTYVAQFLSGADLGVWTPAVVALLSVAVNAVRKISETPAVTQ